MLFFFIQCVLSLTLLLSFGHTHYLCNWEGETWQYATGHCNLANGKLLTTDNLEEIDLSELVKVNATEFWTSNVIEVAHAVEYIGCYVYSIGVPQTNLIPARGGINLVDCQSACSSSYNIYTIYGLYDDRCICLFGRHAYFDLSNQSCFQNCSINTLEFCTDSKLIALYRRIRYDSTKLQIPNFATNKCVAQVNSTTKSTENCQKYLPYQCNGKIHNGTFLNAIDKCGGRYNKTIDSLDYSWKPVFFPTINRIKYQYSGNENHLKMMICTSFKIDGSHTYLIERKCTDSLPYICKTDDIIAASRHLRPCNFRNKPTASQTDGTGTSVTLTTLDTTSTTIVQYGPRNSVKLSPTNTTYTLIENTTFNTPIYCQADCRPECTYKWNTSSGNNPLIFGKVDRSQAGTYVCTATNLLGSSEVSITVIVQCAPRVSSSNTIRVYVTIGQKLNINTSFIAYPSPDITWFCNGNLIEDKLINTTQTTEYEVISLLYINLTMVNDLGIYTVVAENAFGKTVVSFIVQDKPKATELSLDRGVIVGSVFAGLVFVVFVTLLTTFLYRRKWTHKPKTNKQTFRSPESREQNESKYEDLQTRSETNDYDIPGTEAQYENNTSSISNGPMQYEPLHDRKNISTYEDLELNDKKTWRDKPLYANPVAK